MPPQSRGTAPQLSPKPSAYHSKSTPNLPTLSSLRRAQETNDQSTKTTSKAKVAPHAESLSPDAITSPSEPASIEDYSLDSAHEPPSLSSPPYSGDDDDGEASDASEEEDDGPVPNLPPRPIYHHHHSRSHTHLAPSTTFAPPFYNRPPTPLPPSPSLTSLLRPNFSSQNSRPSTPYGSSDEGGTPHTRGGGGGGVGGGSNVTGTQTPNSAAASTLTSTARAAKPIPRASPKVPTYEYYGFTLYLTSSLVFIGFILWSYLPSPFLYQLGIFYFPHRWWALAIPAWIVMLVVYIYVALASYNTGYLTLCMDNVGCLVDEAAKIAVADHSALGRSGKGRETSASWRQSGVVALDGIRKTSNGRSRGGGISRKASNVELNSMDHNLDWRNVWNEGTDAVMDIPLGGVCEVLYGRDHEASDLEDMLETELAM